MPERDCLLREAGNEWLNMRTTGLVSSDNQVHLPSDQSTAVNREAPN